MMNLRQVLEAGAAAAFAIANPEPEHFAMTDAGFIDPSQQLTKKRHQWLDKNFPAGSAAIKENKDRINNYFAHANVVLTNQTFEVNEAINEISTPFFDVEDEFQVKFDLWLTASISIDLMYLLYGVNKGRDVVKFIPNFESDLHQFHQRNSALRREMQSTERYKRAFAMMRNFSE